jgi:hypothetical protein
MSTPRWLSGWLKVNTKHVDYTEHAPRSGAGGKGGKQLDADTASTGSVSTGSTARTYPKKKEKVRKGRLHKKAPSPEKKSLKKVQFPVQEKAEEAFHSPTITEEKTRERVEEKAENIIEENLQEETQTETPPQPPTAEVVLQNRKRLIQQSWRLIETGPAVAMIEAFYCEILERHSSGGQSTPSLAPMFEGTNMKLHSVKMYEVVRIAVRFIDHMDGLIPHLQDLGARHARGYGVKRAHYAPFIDVFVEVMNQCIARQMPADEEDKNAVLRMEVAAAWSWLFTSMGEVMADAGEAAVRTA